MQIWDVSRVIGQRIGNYRIVRSLGSGGMGTVYEGIHEGIKEHVAIKILHPQYAADPVISTRFVNEALAVNVVRHPGLVRISDHGHLTNGSAYLIMEFLDGESLRHRMQQVGPLGADALRLCRQLATALAVAHQNGVIHRDLKPENIMIVPDSEAPGGERTKILDFGIARVAAEHQDMPLTRTKTGVLMGTPNYMSPEQCHGANKVETQSDVYSLGVILYEMLSGRPPFASSGLGEVMAMHLFHTPPALMQLAPNVPEEVANLVHRMLEKEPGHRPTMAEVEADLIKLAAQSSFSPQGARPAPNTNHSPSTTLSGSSGETPGLITSALQRIGVLLFILLSVSGTAIFLRGRVEPTSRPTISWDLAPLERDEGSAPDLGIHEEVSSNPDLATTDAESPARFVESAKPKSKSRGTSTRTSSHQKSHPDMLQQPRADPAEVPRATIKKIDGLKKIEDFEEMDHDAR